MSSESKDPFDKKQKWWSLASIQIAGGIISMPVIMTGAQIFLSNGPLAAIISIIAGNLIILAISWCIIAMSFKNRLNAIENIERIIGQRNARIAAALILVTMIGWLARQLGPAVDLLYLFPVFSKIGNGTLIGVVASLIASFGMKGLKRLSLFSIIPLIALCFAMLMIAEPYMKNQVSAVSTKAGFSGIGLVVSVLAASIVDYPTFFRHSATKRNAIISLFVILVVTVLVQAIAVYSSRIFLIDRQVFSEIVATSSFHALIVSLFLIISMIASSAWNIYAASVGLESLFPHLKGKVEYSVIGLVAIGCLSSLPIGAVIVPTTCICDTLISGIGGVMIFDFLRDRYFHLRVHALSVKWNTLCWCMSGVAGILVYSNHSPFLPTYSTLASLGIGLLSAGGMSVLLPQVRKIYRSLIGR